MYHNTAFPLGIIIGNAARNDIDLEPWFASRYIHCQFDDRSPTNKFNLSYAYIKENWAVEDKLLLRHSINIRMSVLDRCDWDIIQLLKEAINNGYYPNGLYNEEMIPGKKSYLAQYYLHDYMLYGYDDEKKSFLSAGYLSDQKYESFLIPYANMKAALLSRRDGKLFLDFWKYNEKKSPCFDYFKLKKELKLYLDSAIPASSVLHKKVFYGSKALSALGIRLREDYKRFGVVDPRYTRGIMEHKFFMKLRVEFLMKNGYIKKERYYHFANDVYKMAERIHLLGIKFTIRKKGDIDITTWINEMQEKERSYLNDIVSELQGGAE
jgi:hypothetical protein